MKIKYELKPDSSESDFNRELLRMFRDGKALIISKKPDEIDKLINELYKIGYQWKDRSVGSSFKGYTTFDKTRSHLYGLAKTKYTDGGLPFLTRCITYGNTIPDGGSKSGWKLVFFVDTLLDNIEIFKELVEENKVKL